MTVDTSWSYEVRVAADGVEATRTLTGTPAGIGVSLEIQSERDVPVCVEVVDDFPADLPVDYVEYRRDNEPDTGRIRPDGATITQTIDDDPVRIEYAIALEEPVGPIQFDDPRIVGVETAELTRSTGAPAPAPDSSPDAADTASDSPDGSFDPAPLLDLSLTMDDEPDGAADAPADRASDPAPADTPEPPSTGPDDEQRRKSEPADRSISPVREAESTAREAGSTAREAGSAAGGGEPSRTESDQPIPSDADAPARRSEKQERSVDVRLDHLSARVEEFASYASHLRTLIDEYGSVPELIAQVEAEVDAFEGRLMDVHDEIESVRQRHETDVEAVHGDLQCLDGAIEQNERIVDRHASALTELDTDVSGLADSIDDLEGGMGDVHGEIDRLDDAITRNERIAEQHESALTGLETDVDGLTDDVDGLEDTLRDVQGDVEGLDDEVERLGFVLERHGSGLTSLEGEVATLETALDDLDSDLERVDDTVDTIEGDVRANDDAIAALERDVGEMRGDLGSLKQTVEAVDRQVSTVADDVDDIQAELQQLTAAIEDLRAFRGSLATAVGALPDETH